MNSLNYMSLDAAYGNTYLSHKFDVENSIGHTPERNYQQTIDNINALKANGTLPLNEQNDPDYQQQYQQYQPHKQYQEYPSYSQLSQYHQYPQYSKYAQYPQQEAHDKYQTSFSCNKIMQHIQHCTHCKEKLRRLIQNQLQINTTPQKQMVSQPKSSVAGSDSKQTNLGIQNSKIYSKIKLNKNTVLIVLFILLFMSIAGLLFEVSITLSRKRNEKTEQTYTKLVDNME